MKTFIRTFLITLLGVLVANIVRGQGPPSPSSTVTQVIYTGLNNIPGSGVIVQNIGQGAHIIAVQERNAPGQTCSPGTIGQPGLVLVSLEYSVNAGASWNLLAQIVGDPSNNVTSYTRYATGVFPGLRISVYGFDTTNCILDVNYTGSLYPIGNIPSEYNGYLTTSCSPVICAGLTTTAVATTMTAALAHNAHFGQHLSLYSLYMVNLSASPESVIISFTSAANGCVANYSPQTITMTLPGGGTAPVPFIMPASTAPYVVAGPVTFTATPIPAPEVVCVQLGANPSGHNVVAQATYRIEP